MLKALMKRPSSMLLSECCSPSSTDSAAHRTVPVIPIREEADRGLFQWPAISCVRKAVAFIASDSTVMSWGHQAVQTIVQLDGPNSCEPAKGIICVHV